MSGNIVPANERLAKIKSLVRSPEVMKEITNALPSHITPERMARTFLTAVVNTPKLLECDPESLIKAVVEASQLGLPTDGVLGHGYILPYGSKAKFIPGYRGLMDLARRSGQVDFIQARVVYENDEFDYEYGLQPMLRHKEAPRSDGEEPKVKAVYAAARLSSGESVFEVMYVDDIEKIRQRSPSGKSGPWVTDWEEMARKTLIRRLMKYLPLSTDVQSAVIAEEYAEAGILGKLLGQEDATEDSIDAESVTTLESLVGDGEDKPEPNPNFDGKGRISDEEEERFQNAVQAVLERARASSTEEMTDKMYNKYLGIHGVESISEIRSRIARKDFYHDILEEVKSWEELD